MGVTFLFAPDTFVRLNPLASTIQTFCHEADVAIAHIIGVIVPAVMTSASPGEQKVITALHH